MTIPKDVLAAAGGNVTEVDDTPQKILGGQTHNEFMAAMEAIHKQTEAFEAVIKQRRPAKFVVQTLELDMWNTAVETHDEWVARLCAKGLAEHQMVRVNKLFVHEVWEFGEEFGKAGTPPFMMIEPTVN